jgi:hypothetical protein
VSVTYCKGSAVLSGALVISADCGAPQTSRVRQKRLYARFDALEMPSFLICGQSGISPGPFRARSLLIENKDVLRFEHPISTLTITVSSCLVADQHDFRERTDQSQPNRSYTVQVNR